MTCSKCSPHTGLCTGWGWSCGELSQNHMCVVTTLGAQSGAESKLTHSLWITVVIHRCGRMRSTVIYTAVDTVCDAVGNVAALTCGPNPLSLGLCLRPFRACVPAIARAYVLIAQPIPSGKPLPAEENCRDHQADLPAQQPSSFEDARLPSAHVDPRRPRHSGCPPSQGPRQAVRLRHPGAAARAPHG